MCNALVKRFLASRRSTFGLRTEGLCTSLLENLSLLQKSQNKHDLLSYEHQIFSRHQPKCRII